MKIIKVFLSCSHRPMSNGSYGSYYHITKQKGGKLVCNYKQAKEEARLLQIANKVDFTPKCYGIAKVTFNRGINFSFGILQEHIEGKPSKSLCSEREQLKKRATKENRTLSL